MPADWRALRAALPPDPYVLAAQLANAQQTIRELRRHLAMYEAMDAWRAGVMAQQAARQGDIRWG